MKHTLPAAFLLLALTTPAAAQFDVSPPGATSTPPPPGPIKALAVPAPVETTLPNGLRVIAVRTTNVPLVSAALVSKRGTASDPPGKLGAASLTAAVMTAGTTTRDAAALARAIDRIGATLTVSASSDDTAIRTSATTDKFSQALDLVADVARNATLPDEEVARARTQALAEFEETYANIEGLSREVGRRALFGAEAYGNPPAGTPTTVALLQRADLVAFRDAAFRPDNTILVIAGDIDPSHAFELAQTSFGSWAKPSTPPQATAPTVIASAPRFIVIDKEEAGAGTISASFRSVTRTSPEYAAGAVTNSVLNGYSARLNEEVRVKRGLAYGAGSRIVALQTDGLVVAYTLSVENPKIAEATGVVIDTLESLAKAPVAQTELDTRRRSFLGGRATQLQRESGVVELLSDYAVYGLPLASLRTADADYTAITPAQVQAFAAKYLTRPTIVVIGKASVFLPALQAKYKDVEVVQFKDLDLSTPALKKGG